MIFLIICGRKIINNVKFVNHRIEQTPKTKAGSRGAWPNKNRPGTAQVGAISRAQKLKKDFKVSSILFYSTRIRKKLKIFFWSPVSRIVPKNVKGGPLGVFEHPFFCKIEKIEGGPSETLKKFAKKSLTMPKTCTKNFLVMGGTRIHVLLLGRPQKSLNKLYVKCQ